MLEAAETLGLTEALINAAPTMEQVVRASNSDLSEQQQRALFEAAGAAYTALNTRLYKEVIKPSIVHTPEWRKEDEEERDAMFDSGGIKDGRGYYLWLLPKANTTGLVDQGKFRKITTRPLPPTADRTVLDRHMLEHLAKA